MGRSTSNPGLHEALKEALGAGDRALALELAWELFKVPLAAFALDCGAHEDDLADLLQDAFSRTLEGWEIFSGGPGELRGWLYTLVSYEVKTWRHRRDRALRERSAAWSDALEQARLDGQLTDYIHLGRVLDAVICGDAVNRAVFLSVYFFDHDTREAVAHVERLTGRKLTPAALRARLLRLRARIRKVLEEDNR